MAKKMVVKKRLEKEQLELQKLLQKLQSCMNTENELKKLIIEKQGYLKALKDVLDGEKNKKDE